MNVLVIHADQHRWDCIGTYGNPSIRTPNMDRLAADGVRYDNSFCTYPVCTPSRYSLLSGRYVWEHRGWTNHCTLARDIPTFPRLLRAGGYRTAAVGKMHFTPTYLDVGFSTMVLAEQDGDGRWDDDYHRMLMDRGLIDIVDIEDQRAEFRSHAPREYWDIFGALASNLPEELHSTTWITDRALEQVNTWNADSNLLMVGYIKPHHPFDPPQSWLDRYDPNTLALPAGWTETVLGRNEAQSRDYFPNADLTEMAMRHVSAAYYASISHIDAQIGRIVNRLKEAGLYDSTLIIYTSDHGEYLGHHHMILKGNHMYDPLVKVPLIIKYPHGAFAGKVRAGQVSSLDVSTTILHQAGCGVPDSMHGGDLATDHDGREFILAEGWQGSEVMVRTDTRKLLLNAALLPLHLFDLSEDPYELDDLQQTYLNPDEPVVEGANVPPSDGSHRARIRRYYAEQAAALRGLDPEAYLS